MFLKTSDGKLIKAPIIWTNGVPSFTKVTKLSEATNFNPNYANTLMKEALAARKPVFMVTAKDLAEMPEET